MLDSMLVAPVCSLKFLADFECAVRARPCAWEPAHTMRRLAWGVHTDAWGLIALQVGLAALNVRGLFKTEET
ncbi:hypothetical protein [Variovorax gossypii]